MCRSEVHLDFEKTAPSRSRLGNILILQSRDRNGAVFQPQDIPTNVGESYQNHPKKERRRQ